MNKNKSAPWWTHFLMIPLQFVIDLVIMVIVLWLDNTSSMTLMVITAALLAVMTAYTVTISIYRAMAAHKNKKATADGAAPVSYKTGLAAWQYWLPLLLQILIYTAIVMGAGSFEINRFYANPDHVGFAIPFFSIILALFFTLINLTTLLICLFHFGKALKAKKDNDTEI